VKQRSSRSRTLPRPLNQRTALHSSAPHRHATLEVPTEDCKALVPPCCPGVEATAQDKSYCRSAGRCQCRGARRCRCNACDSNSKLREPMRHHNAATAGADEVPLPMQEKHRRSNGPWVTLGPGEQKCTLNVVPLPLRGEQKRHATVRRAAVEPLPVPTANANRRSTVATAEKITEVYNLRRPTAAAAA
jgi:hypothetical protein